MPRSRAGQMQAEWSAFDLVLLQLARRQHPNVSHWWGRRYEDSVHGARCYLCGQWIARWDFHWPITEAARAAISEHRRGHLDELAAASESSVEES